jgi:hypothetical protein
MNGFPIAGEVNLEVFPGLGIIVTLPVGSQEPRMDDVLHAPIHFYGDNTISVLKFIAWAGLVPRWQIPQR